MFKLLTVVLVVVFSGCDGADYMSGPREPDAVIDADAIDGGLADAQPVDANCAAQGEPDSSLGCGEVGKSCCICKVCELGLECQPHTSGDGETRLECWP